MQNRNQRLRNLSFAALFVALTAAGALFKIPMGVTFITLQFFFTAMAGILLGPKYGALSQGVYVLLGLIGIPIFTQGGGPGYLLIPSCGFLFGLIPAAWVIGMLTKKKDGILRLVLACVAGDAVLYLIGLPYLYCILNLYMGKGLSVWAVLSAGMLIYLPGDALKITATVILSKPIKKALSTFL
jgi:biotin transport system substrate-specific component